MIGEALERWSWAFRSDRNGIRTARQTILFAAINSPEKFCGQDHVLIRYLQKYALADADWILTIHHSNKLVGFALIKKRGSGWRVEKDRMRRKSGRGRKWVELDVICAWDVAGLGTRILKEVERFSAAQGAELVELHSVPNAIHFYRSRGYVNAGKGFCSELSVVTAAAIKSQLNEKRFRTPNEAIADPEYRKFLSTIASIGSAAGALKGCQGIGLERPQCSYYGYRMNRCLN
jgi:hypothetical protein